MKTTVKQFAAITFIALLLLVVNVKTEATEIKAASLEVIETTLHLENWMTDDSLWNTDFSSNIDFFEETESIMELENWMTSETTWSLNSILNIEPEKRLEFKKWMINDKKWNSYLITIEPTLPLENWMINNKLWE